MNEWIAKRREESRKAREIAATLTTESAAQLLRNEIDKLEANPEAGSADILAFYQLVSIISKHPELAMEFCMNRDTGFRDVVPKPIWAFIGGHFVYE